MLTLKIKYRAVNPCNIIHRYSKGEWLDLRTTENIILQAPTIKENSNEIEFHIETISLGIAMQLPKGFEANILPRSSTISNYGSILSNSMGIIDSTYCGNDDIWKVKFIPIKSSHIGYGDRIVQFRIRPGQFASVWTRIKWLFTSKIEFILVDKLEGENRGGFGSTGKK